MSQSHVDDMLAELTGGGVLAARGEFELDASKAREKMSKFQLQDPLAYVLEFVQASYLLGAERFDVIADSDEFEITWRGEALHASDLESLYSAAFSRQTEKRLLALKHMAIGVNAASALDLSRLVIEGVEPDGRLFRWTQIGEVEQVEFIERAEGDEREPGYTRIYLKERLRWGHIGEFFGRLRREVEEIELIKRKCRYSPQEIYLNGKLFEHGIDLPSNCVARIEFSAEHIDGVAGLVEGREYYELEVTQHGVLVGGAEMMNSIIGGHVIVNADHLQKDLSRSSLVEDEAWRDLMLGLIPDVLDELAARHLGQMMGYSPDSTRVARPDQHKWVEQWLGRSLLARCNDLDAGREWGKGSESLYQIARRYPLLVIAHPHKDFDMKFGEKHPRSFKEVERVLQRQTQPAVLHCTTVMEEVDMVYPVLFEPGSQGVVAQDSWKLARGEEGVAGIFATLQGWRLRDMNNAMSIRRKRLKNEAVWRARDLIEDFEAPADSVVSVYRTSGQLRYTWSWSEHNAPPQLVYVREGRLFATRLLLTHPLLLGVKLTVEAPFNTNAYFSDVLLDSKHFEFIARAIAQFPEFIRERVAWLDRAKRLWGFYPFIMEYLTLLFSGGLFDLLVKTFHGSMVRPDQLRKASHYESHAHWKLAARLADLPVPGQRFEAFEALEALAHAPLVNTTATGSGEQVLSSLSDLAKIHDEHGHLGYVTSEFNLRKLEFLEPGRQILVLDQQTQRKLEVLVSRFVLEDQTEELERELEVVKFRKKPRVEDISARWDSALARTEFVIASSITCKGALWPLMQIEDAFERANVSVSGNVQISGSANLVVGGVSFTGERPEGSISIQFVYEDREVLTQISKGGVGRFELQVDATHLPLEPDFSDVRRGTLFLKIGAMAKEKSWECASHAVEDLASRVDELDTKQWRVLWGMIDLGLHGETMKELRAASFVATCKGLRVFRDHTSQRWMNHDELIACEDYRGRLFFVYEGEEVHDELLPKGHRQVVELPAPELRRQFARVVGEGAELVHVAHSDEAIERVKQARAKFMERPVLSWSEPAGYGKQEFVWRRPLQIGDRSGSIGMWLDRDPRSSVAGVQIELLHQGRRIQTASRLTYIGRFGVRIEADDLDVDPSWDRLASTTALQVLCSKITEEVARGLAAELEEIYTHPQDLSPPERLMWLGYMQVVEKSKPQKIDEAELAQLITGLPLFERVDGVWCNVAQVRECAMRNASKVYVLDSLDKEIPERYLTNTFLLPSDQERAVWRDIFDRAVINDLDKLLEAIARIREIKVSGKPKQSSFAGASRAWDAKKKEEEESSARIPEPPEQSASAVLAAFSDEVPERREPAVPMPAPRLEPQPEPEPEPIDPQRLFEERVLEELRQRLLADHTSEHDLMYIQDDLIRHLDFGEVADNQRLKVTRGGVTLDRRHVAVQALGEDEDDAMWWHVLVSSVYSAINTHYREVTDEHEALFLRELGKRSSSRTLQRP